MSAVSVELRPRVAQPLIPSSPLSLSCRRPGSYANTGLLLSVTVASFLWREVGKTALTSIFQLDQSVDNYYVNHEGRYSSDRSSCSFYSPTLHCIDTCRKKAVIDDEIALIDILDVNSREYPRVPRPEPLRSFPSIALASPLPRFVVSNDVLSLRPAREKDLRRRRIPPCMLDNLPGIARGNTRTGSS